MVFTRSYFQFLLNIKLLCWFSTVPSNTKTEAIILFVAFYGHLYQHLDMELLQSDIPQSTAHFIEEKPSILPTLSHVAWAMFFVFWPSMT